MFPFPPHYAFFAALGYFIGGFPTGVVLSRGKYGIDVREMGSGNIGATNITRVFGWYAGVLTFVVDAAKGLVTLLLIRRFWPYEPWLLTITGAFLVFGHCFSPYLKFRGGKGVATSLGCMAAVSPWCAGIAAAVYVTLLAVSRISAIGSLGGVASALVYIWFSDPAQYVKCLIYAVSFVVVVRHRSNIVRLVEGFKAKRSKP